MLGRFMPERLMEIFVSRPLVGKGETVISERLATDRSLSASGRQTRFGDFEQNNLDSPVSFYVVGVGRIRVNETPASQKLPVYGAPFRPIRNANGVARWWCARRHQSVDCWKVRREQNATSCGTVYDTLKFRPRPAALIDPAALATPRKRN